MLVYPLARGVGWGANFWCDGAYGLYFLSYAAQAILFGPAVRATLRARNESLPGWGIRRTLTGLLAVPVAQVLHIVALVNAATMRRVVWRGVHYRLGVNPPLTVAWDESPAEAEPEPLPLARSA
jgi:hypothetical protein